MDPYKQLVDEMNLLCYKIFIQSHDGRKLYDILVELFIINSPRLDMSTPYYKDAMLANEGRNAFIRHLKQSGLLFERLQQANNEVNDERNKQLNTEYADSLNPNIT